ncbi:ribosomal protein S18-alanine N-acetyltransferase [Microbacterium sp. SORGH_AS_0888]|uniref:ribosomal protein S18-alanine N-acetyltransferase n=1 Tax=Microbacterium sp. SORGH_AS_0888 TaxID=3041791 RepID=UPI002788E992|nr:ribosomal protein S18-alanine N-acetyltransferase [Microbacterium sp. SORGH_AS_0888]MDQ1129244.1 ribosomal-protein-alanine N-acetyltransferase [Microbacterium sp. SORGH_AS_0888]
MIRTATLDDLAEIMRLERASFPTDAWSEAMMREELGSPHGHYLALDVAGRLAGYAGLRAVAGAHDGDVQTITVAEHARGRGSGRLLLRALLEIAAERGVRDVFLEVRDDNPVAQRLYLSEGFVEVGRRPRYYQPDDVDAIVMQLDVRSWAGAAVSITQADRPDTAGQAPSATILPELRAPGAADAAPAADVARTTAGTGWC